MGRSHLVSSPKATISRMKSILALVLLGVAIIHLSGATEEETDKQVAQQENQLELSQVQELAEADAKKRVRKNKSGKGKKGKKCRNGRCRKGKARRAKKGRGKGKRKGKRRQRKKAKKARKAKKAKKTKKAKKRSQRKRQRN